MCSLTGNPLSCAPSPHTLQQNQLSVFKTLASKFNLTRQWPFKRMCEPSERSAFGQQMHRAFCCGTLCKSEKLEQFLVTFSDYQQQSEAFSDFWQLFLKCKMHFTIEKTVCTKKQPSFILKKVFLFKAFVIEGWMYQSKHHCPSHLIFRFVFGSSAWFAAC